MDKNKLSPRVSARCVLIKQTDESLIDFCSGLAMLNGNLNVILRGMLKLLENCAKTSNHITSIFHEITEMRQKYCRWTYV